jgi:hypothetical protein
MHGQIMMAGITINNNIKWIVMMEEKEEEEAEEHWLASIVKRQDICQGIALKRRDQEEAEVEEEVSIISIMIEMILIMMGHKEEEQEVEEGVTWKKKRRLEIMEDGNKMNQAIG